MIVPDTQDQVHCELLSQIKASLEAQPPFVAGGLRYKIDNWKKLTTDCSMIDIVQGFSLDFTDLPKQFKLPGQILKGPAEVAIAEELLQKLLNKRVIEETNIDRSGYISNIFLRPKSSGGHRLILNLKNLNEHVEYHHFKMDHLAAVLPLITKNCYLASLDLADAYYSVNVSNSHRKYLQFSFNDKHYRFTCLANGISSAPRTFTKLMKIPLATLREKHGLVLTAYLDDLLLVASTPQKLLSAIDLTQNMLRSLGYHISLQKSAIVPSHTVQFLGVIIDSRTMSVRLPQQKIETIKDTILENLQQPVTSIRKFATLVGKLTATLPANRYGQVFLKHLEMAKTKALYKSNFNFEGIISISSKVIAELQWWKDNIATVFRPVFVPNPHIVLYTDASFQGWGYHIQDTELRAGGRWSTQEQSQDINYLELKAVYFSLLSSCKDITNSHILIQSDNTTTVVGINKQGSTQSANCNSVARDIWFWAIKQNNWLSATHCPGIYNVEADYASRVFNDSLEWQLQPKMFELICDTFGTPTVDFFASRLNCQLPVYCAWQPDPGAMAIDCFTLNWSKFDYCYFFPPFSVVAKTLQKIEAECEKSIIIVPHWPTQPWFGKLLQLMTRKPLEIPVKSQTLRLAHKPQTIHPLKNRLTLWACYISSNITSYKD